jgi:hypothetical protein
MKCPNCNAEISDTAKFCPECGNKIDSKRFCQKCGTELQANAKFCPECGTACQNSAITVQDEDDQKDIFIITRGVFDKEALGNEYDLLSFDITTSENENIADARIDDDGDVIIRAFSIGRVKIRLDFTYKDMRRNIYEATWIGTFKVRSGNEIILEEGMFANDNDEDYHDSNNISAGDVIGGIAAFAGGFLGGLASYYDDDDDDEWI